MQWKLGVPCKGTQGEHTFTDILTLQLLKLPSFEWPKLAFPPFGGGWGGAEECCAFPTLVQGYHCTGLYFLYCIALHWRAPECTALGSTRLGIRNGDDRICTKHRWMCSVHYLFVEQCHMLRYCRPKWRRGGCTRTPLSCAINIKTHLVTKNRQLNASEWPSDVSC